MPSNTSRANRDRRQREAADRQAAYDALTPEQKLDLLGESGSVKQRAKLTKQIDA